MEASKIKAVGIDDMAVYIPNLYLPIADLAAARSIAYAKLNKGLGLTDMALADVHEDVATMAANAVLDLIKRNQLHPQQIGRIYLGTESSVDGSKPMATYVLEMLSAFFEADYGKDCFLNCDVVDLTFACIGSVDAMHNTLDWVKNGGDRIGIVVGSDLAKYELNSTGEYTQGAGAVALLIKENPRLMSLSEAWGVATRGVHDFFKPVRTVNKRQLVKEVLSLLEKENENLDQIIALLDQSLNVDGVLDDNNQALQIHKDTPIFDGPYSNDCYQERIGEALQHFAHQAGYKSNETITDNWRRLIFHLPYAYQARRMFTAVFLEEAKKRGDWSLLKEELGMEEPLITHFEDLAEFKKANSQFLRAISKTERYQKFVKEKMAKGEWASSYMGNLYTSSIFLSLMSTLERDLEAEVELEGSQFGFFAYGSGSKSKVFEGTIEAGWKSVVEQFQIAKTLSKRQAIDYATYEKLHRGQLSNSVSPIKDSFYLERVCTEKGVREGARTYKWAKKTGVGAVLKR